MLRRKKLDHRLQSLLKGRPIPVDEDRLEAMRRSLLKQVSGRVPVAGFGSLRRYRLALGSCAALIMIGVFVLWPYSPLRQDDPKRSVAYDLRGVMEDENELDHLLVLLNNFVSTRSQEGKLIDWEFYNRPLSGHYRDRELFETFYEWLYVREGSGDSAFM